MWQRLKRVFRRGSVAEPEIAPSILPITVLYTTTRDITLLHSDNVYYKDRFVIAELMQYYPLWSWYRCGCCTQYHLEYHQSCYELLQSRHHIMYEIWREFPRRWFRQYVAAELMAHVWHPRNMAKFAGWGIDADL